MIYCDNKISIPPSPKYHPGTLAVLTKPKNALSMTTNASNELLQNLQKNYSIEFSTSHQLPDAFRQVELNNG